MKIHETAALAMERLKGAGAEQYAAQAHSAQKREFNVDGGHFSLLRTTFDRGLDLTAIVAGARGKVAGNDFSPEAVNAAAQDCIASAKSAQKDEAWKLYEGERQSFELGEAEADLDRLFERAQELLLTIKKDYPKVMVEQMIVSHTKSEGVYLNSLGAEYRTLEGRYDVSLMFSGHEGDKTSSFNGVGLCTQSLDVPLIELGSARQCLRDIEQQVETQALSGKFEGSVVLTPDCAEEVLGELINSFAGGMSILDGTSPWKDKLNTQVADSALNILVAPHDQSVVCGERYQGDGRLSEDYALIENGLLRQFALSSYVANKTGHKAAPNGSMSLVVAPGGQSLQDILGGIQKGLLVSRFSGGSPASNGDFSGVAKNSFLIENGRIGPAVSETMISGNLAEMVRKLRGISSERVGSGNGLMPWIAVDGITISGK